MAPRFARAALAAAVGAALVMGESRARAQPEADRAVARALVAEAAKLLAHGQVAEACLKLEESRKLAPGPETTIKLADCYERSGRTASAWSLYLDAAAAEREARHGDRARAAEARANALEPKLSRLTLMVTQGDRTPGLVVKRDEIAVGRAQWGVSLPIDPGRYTIYASAPGRYSWRAVTVVGASGALVTTVVPELPVVPQVVVDPSQLSRRERRDRREGRPPRGERNSVGMMVTGIVLIGLSPFAGVLAGLGVGKSGAKFDGALAAGFGVFLGVAAIGIPLTIVGAQRGPARAQGQVDPEARLQLVISPGSTVLKGVF